MIYILTSLFFVFGLIIGSFLNVVICRLNSSKSLGGRSMCMSCHGTLCWYHLVPLFSFLFLGGRCAFCKTKISIQYPIVEFITGFIFALIFWKFQDILFVSIFSFLFVYIYYVFMFALFMVIAVYDLRHKIIPDMLVFIFGILAFLGMFFFKIDGVSNISILFPHIPSILEFLSGLIVALPFALLWLVSSGRWIGLGDAKLAIGIGYLLGIGMALSAIAISFWSGAIIGIFLVFLSKKKGNYSMKTEIPFAMYLLFGTLIAFLFELHIFIL
jgi:leader peptidase (prepilin peptidase) / N-methyltransferase